MRLAASAGISLLLSLPAGALPVANGPTAPDGLAVLEIQSLCGAIGNCPPGLGGGSNVPRHTLTPDVGRFDLGNDNRYGRYRYEQPDLQLNLEVPKMQGNQRPRQPRLSGSRTIYRVEKLSADHVDWCYSRYKSYRAKDNTYKPDKGPRKICVSPFS